ASSGGGREGAGDDRDEEYGGEAAPHPNPRAGGAAMRMLALLLVAVGFAEAQQIKLNLDHLAAKAADSVDISLNGSMLQFAAKFLDGKDPDEARTKKLIAGIEGIYVRSFEFKKDGEWSQAD